MPTEDPFNTSVTYTVKELLDDIRGKLEMLIARMDTKVDRAELQTVTARQDEVVGRLNALEAEFRHAQAEQDEATEARRYRMPVQLTVILVVATVVLIGLGVAELAMHVAG